MTYILDSDMLIYFFNQEQRGYELVAHLIEKKERVVISMVSVMEIRAGWNNAQAREYMPKVYDLFPVEPITLAIAERAGMLRYEGKQQGRKPKVMDTLIAATALERNHCLITNNTKDYPISQLHIYKNVII